MRLHRLELRAFGPFREAQVVDFDQLSEAGLFLLTGDTGAGKTSILDAVAYALYGQVPGRRESAMRVRSDHAATDVATRVQLELSVRGQRLRIMRTPDWDRPKKRGTGTTREKGKVLLERQEGGEWSFVSSRHDEAGHELTRLLGMTHEQFCQVVLLPQGDFAAFLSATAETRKHLLERLFGTERFSAVERWLVDESRASSMALAQVRENVSSVLGSLRRLDRDRQLSAPEASMPGDVLLEWGDRVASELGVRREVAEAAAGRATDRLTAQRQVLDLARSLAERQRQLADLQAEHDRLSRDEEAIATLQDEVAAARRVSSVEPLITALDDAGDEVVAAEIVRREAIAALKRIDPDVTDEPGAAELRTLERGTRDELARMPAALLDERRHEDISAELAAVTAELDRLAAAQHEVAGAMLAAPAERGALETRAADLRQLAALLPTREMAAAECDRAVIAAHRRDELTRHLAAAQAACLLATEEALNAREDALATYERRLAGMAAELASGLRPGASCPVCGSDSHPAPAPPASNLVTEADEAAARARTVAAEHRRADRDADRLALMEARALAAVEAGGDDDVRVLAAAAQVAQAALTASTAAVTELADVARALVTLEAETKRLTELAVAGTSRAAELAGRRDSLAREVEALSENLRRALGDAPSVAGRASVLRRRADALGAAAAAIESAAAAASAFADAERRATLAARRAGCSDLTAAAVAVREEAYVETAQRRIDDHRELRAVVAAGLARPDLADLPSEAADVAAAESDVEAATVAERDARHDLGWLRRAAESAGDLVVDLRSSAARLEPLQRTWETVDGLARLASGGADNRLRMRLSYYVLSARLEQVAAAASERLLRMSDQRFSLLHTDERSPGNQRSGLGLRVHDSWYATDRDPATLSGGESFMASLALALGLADVVTSEAGGTSMETLFVDEGFGGLDTETLDAVLDVLDGLRAGGRSVGLVSHVAELRTRVPVQLDVRRARGGSTLALRA